MADAHGSHGTHGSYGSHEHAHHEPEEDPLRTPGWMPLVGFALLLAGALGVYLFISPGVMSAPAAAGDAAVEGDAAAEPGR